MDIEHIVWDSNNFGFKVGGIELNSINEKEFLLLQTHINTNFYKLVYLKVDYKIDFLDYFFDEKIVFKKQRILYSKIKNNNIVSCKNQMVTKEMKELSIYSGIYSRYNLDVDFPDNIFKDLYIKWIENSVMSDFATDVLVYKINNLPIALLTYKIINDEAQIGIVAVDHNYRNSGIGSKIIKYFEANLPLSVKCLKVATQGINVEACHYYEKNGYSIYNKSYIYHVWNKDLEI